MTASGNGFYAVDASNLSVVLGGRKVLDVPSVKVNANEVLVIIGPNGSGKSTLLLSLALLLKPRTGSVAYGGRVIAANDEILRLHRRLALVLQEPVLLNSSVWENITLGL